MSLNKKSLTKRTAVFACVLSLCGTVLPSTMPATAVSAETEVYTSAENKTVSGGYYYDNLTIANKEYDLGKKFYAVLDGMRESGDFKDGKISYSLDGIVSSDQLKAWVENGDLTVPKAFGAARDSFLMDHPELFYIDIYKIMINAGYSGGKYTGYLDSGREPNIYRDNAFKSEAEVNTAVSAYDAAVKKFADDAKSHVDQISSIYKNDGKLAVAANIQIAENVKYDYAVYSDYMENGENAASVSSLAHTAYGALVNKKAVCSGYSFGYKAVMDALGIPTVVVSGYSTGKDRSGNNTSGNVAHSWNYVKLEVADKSGATNSGVQTSADEQKKVYDWFAFDTTWNSVNPDENKYSVMNAESASEEHMPDSVVSSSNYPLNYPALSSVPYEEAVNPDSPRREITSGGFNCSVKYTPSGSSYIVDSYASYNGKNSGDLVKTENLRLAQRMYYMKDGTKQWTQWQDLANTAAYPIDYGLGIIDEKDKTFSRITNDVQCIQYAVISDLEPDVDIEYFGTTFEKIRYSDAEKVKEFAVFMSEEIENPIYGTYTPPPYILYSRSKPISGTDVTINSNMSEPGNSAMMADSKALDIKLVYDEPLHILDETKDIEVAVSARIPSALDYSGLVKYSDGKYVHLSADENGVLNTIEFKFKPSLMFEHNRVGYHFELKNVGSAKIVEKKNEVGELIRTTSDRTPNTAYYVFSRAIYACPKVFGDGRLYIDCCAQPTLVDNSDLAATGFEDEDGNPTFSESARSQMMLVVNDVRPETEKAILDGIDAGDNGIKKTDIQKSQTYDINLQMCGKIAKIPDKSYVRLALGFPEGYGPDDEGVTFKIFHRKHIESDRYEIEEIPCVVTKFGIVVTVNSFSPYTVVVVPEDKVKTRTITASIDGKGGTLGKDDGMVRSIAENDSYTYTLTPAAGYQIYKVLLNGKDVTDKVSSDDRLKVEYGDLEINNELEIKYISDDAKIRYAANNIVDPVKVIIPIGTDLFGSVPTASPELPAKSSNVGLILGLILGGVALIVAAVAIFFIFKKKKTSDDAKLSKQTASNKPQSDTVRPSTQNSVRPTAQNGTRPTTQNGTRPTTQNGTRPTAQNGTRPTTQNGTRPTTQNGTRPTAQNGTRPSTQNGTRPTTPQNNNKK